MTFPLLSIDTSVSIPSVAIRVGNNIFERIGAREKSHIEALSVLTKELLLEANISASDLKAIILGTGPGSFTGLRIGFSFAKGVAQALSIPIVPVASFAASADEVAISNSLVAVIEDARREEVFLAVYYRGNNSELKLVIDPGIVQLTKLEKILEEERAKLTIPISNIIIATSAKNLLFPKVIEVKEPLYRARHLINIAHLESDKDLLPEGTHSLEQISLLEPYYLRGVAAKSIAERATV